MRLQEFAPPANSILIPLRVERILGVVPKSQSEEEEIGRVEVNAAGLLPRAAGHYVYAGSLTARPCTEGVT